MRILALAPTLALRFALPLALLAGAGQSGCARDRTAPAPAPASGAAPAPTAGSGPPHRAFYYWRTTLRLSPAEARAMQELGVDRLYLRLFDVDWADGAPAPRPVAPLVIGDGHDDGGDGDNGGGRSGDAGSDAGSGGGGSGPTAIPRAVEIVPVIFLRQRVLRRLQDDPAASAALAADAWRAVQRQLRRLGRTAREVQIDCDWTDTTRDVFFDWLGRLGRLARRERAILSATIRLHQVKYRERTGVPPVERGMLMFYNMGRIDADPDASAIFDPARARAYLARVADYPLPLDVALPIWSWVVHVRGDRVQDLLQGTPPEALRDKPWLEPQGARRFRVREAAFLDGALLRAGDFLNVEETTTATIQSAAEMIAPRLAPATAPRTVSLFHLSEKDLARHDTPGLAHVFTVFH